MADIQPEGGGLSITDVHGALAVRDGGDVEDGIRIGQRVVARVIAERAFVAERLGRVNVAFDDEIGLPAEALCAGRRWAKRFSIRTKCFQGSANSSSSIATCSRT
jgi:hypothetical protein